jgi:hypothetical protein
MSAAAANPDLASRMAAAIAAARLAAAEILPTALDTVDSILKEYNARSAAERTAPPAPPGDKPAIDPAIARSLDLRERRLMLSAAYLILRVTRLSDIAPGPRPLYPGGTPLHRPAPPAASPPPPRPPSSHDAIPSFFGIADPFGGLDGNDRADRPSRRHREPSAPAAQLAAHSRTAQSPLAPQPSVQPTPQTDPPLTPLAQRVYEELSRGIPIDEAAGLHSDLVGATDDDVIDIVHTIRGQFGNDYLPALNEIVAPGPAP